MNRKGKKRRRVPERFPLMRDGFKFLKKVKSKTHQFEIVFKSLARFSAQFRVKEILNFYLLYNLRKFGAGLNESL